MRLILITSACVVLLSSTQIPAIEIPESPDPINYNRQIRSILSDHCFSCHGPDSSAREAELRLDRFADATAVMESGMRAISPGDPSASEIIVRIRSESADLQMPPQDSHPPLSTEQSELLVEWIRQGADYQMHWAYEPVNNVIVPYALQSDWTRNEIDLFVARRLSENKFSHSPAADPRTLLRRVAFDLTGLPPDAEDVDAMAANWSQETYENYVDRLLGSPDYGKHWATAWLDAARYADTNGYQHDNGRDMWPWRDWVVDALNSNMPFDQFTIEQLAGDLLPDCGPNQRIATGFNRNHGLNFEGGSIAAESQTDYVVDRTNTVGTVWLGLTLGCAQCHDHKYDPISQRDYYGLFAFFNNIDEKGFAGENGNAAPKIPVPWPEHDQQLLRMESELESLQAAIDNQLAGYDAGQKEWEEKIASGAYTIPDYPEDTLVEISFNAEADSVSPINVGRQVRSVSVDGAAFYVAGPSGSALQLDGKTRLDCGDVGRFDTQDAFTFGAWVWADQQQANPIIGRAHFHGYDLVWENGHFRVDLVNRWDINAIFVKTEQSFPTGQWHHVMVTYDGTGKGSGVTIFVDGQRRPTDVFKDDLTGSIESEVSLFLGARNHQGESLFQGRIDEVRLYDRRLSDVEVAQLAGQVRLSEDVRLPPEQRSAIQNARLREYYLQENVSDYSLNLVRQTELRRNYLAQADRRLTTMVMGEMAKPRTTKVLMAGRYDRPAESVTAGVPDIFPALADQQKLPNRLSLARWLVSGAHPLTARVVVNRYWQAFFGRGIVATSGNFGVQGSLPTHPDLLDWLALEFVDSGWDVKRMHRLIVTSATYQQSGGISKSRLAGDPDNLWLSRFSRRRMSAEVLRDNALAMSGLLTRATGGPSVYPPQPDGLWEELSFLSGHTAQEYSPSTGGDARRRSLYTYWKRSCPPPNMKVFDASERAVCTVRRSVTNTPLQALALMNDPVFVEPALIMAAEAKYLHENPQEAIEHIFWRVRSKRPSQSERRILEDAFSAIESMLTPAEALNVARAAVDSPSDSAGARSVAALATIAQVIMAMDESITVN